ncbi:MAG TPA: methionine--tRNA ligase, partial [Thermoanaerobaculia bacterium]|nr:methionine--tRNA ligase [Thermoanaerobaculia bacterium]
ERHHKGVREIIHRLADAGDLYAATHEGWYCSPCETFYTEKELGPDKTCPVHGTAVEWKSEENVFFRLSKYQQALLDWYDSDLEPVRPATRRNEVRSFVESGLRDLSVSRASLEWGIPFPGYPGQTVYVWLDALTNYISALGYGSGDGDLYRKLWEEGDVRLNLIGKDILRHHAVYWPAFLMSAGLPLPTTVFAHGWWYRDGRKMSKSIGNIVRPDEIIDRFGADPLRYFLLREMVFGQDASFSDEAFIDRYNADLANTLGNTVSRVVTLSRGAYAGKTPPVPCDDNPVLEAARRLMPEYRAAMDELAFSRALEALWKLLNEASQYLVTREPWKLVKEEGPTEKLSRVLWNGLEAVRLVATGLLPFMPKVAPQVLAAIGVTEVPASLDALEWGGTPTSVELPEPRPIFPRIDKKDYLGAAKAPEPAKREKGKEKPLITIDKFFETELKVGTIQAAERVPKSEKLIKLSVDVGEESPRQIVAGIGLAYQPEELVGKQVAVVANLQPAKLMGVESQGMLLAASLDGKPVLLHPEKQVPSGTQVK